MQSTVKSNRRKYRSQAFQAFSGICLLIGSTTSQATVIRGESDAYALYIDLHASAPAVSTTINTVTGNLPIIGPIVQPITHNLLAAIDANATLGPVAPSTVSSPVPGSDSNSLATINASLSGVANVNTGLLTTQANSNVDGLPGNLTTGASAAVNQLDIGVPLLNLLGLSATTLQSTAQVTGDFGSLMATGNTILQETNLNLLGGLVSLDLGAYTGENNQILDVNIDVIADILTSGTAGITSSLLSGLSIILNEQIEDCTNGFCSLAVNAMRISFDNFSHTGLFASLAPLLGATVENTLTLNGDIIISHSYAMMEAIQDPLPPAGQVPEPGSLALVALALGLMLVYRRRLANQGRF
ncbi:PEP-CTERM sorting domain-containing protein [Nitrosomonas sp. ANs5]|uniref:PEP-CTERM sorting domain-containing protein n=1 Tax=Nitrosomonas sp. ANs5 TaxID=3423941 RepID=UPI003D328F11